jgi:hypothetical protein
MKKTLLMSRDIVAVDAAATKIFGKNPEDIAISNRTSAKNRNMNLNELKIVTIPCKVNQVESGQNPHCISLLIFSLFLFLFCGGEKISYYLSSILLPFQFVPALIRTLTNPGTFCDRTCSLIVLTLMFAEFTVLFSALSEHCRIFLCLVQKIGWRRKHSFQKPSHFIQIFHSGINHCYHCNWFNVADQYF